ncbi:hypothetical protein [Rubritalea tangerina]
MIVSGRSFGSAFTLMVWQVAQEHTHFHTLRLTEEEPLEASQ